jgi:2,6-dihydroxypseudooxynicotine hydrolase
MAKDSRVETAITHWAGRFISNGVPLFDFQEITQDLTHWDEWCAAWSERAGVHEAAGRKALAEGLTVSAGEHLERASVLYHFGKFLFVNDMDQMRAAHVKAVGCRIMALPHLDPPGERVEIPFEGGTLAGVLRKPRDVANPPVMIMCVGLDSTKEEMGTNEANFLKRGIATLAFDGPGQGEAEYDLPIRGNYETAVTAIADWIETRDDLDADRMGLWGVSMGGYYAPRAAAFEKRIKACIGISGPYDLGAIWDSFPPLSREAFRVRSHSETEEEARAVAQTLSLEGVAEQITCPLMIITGDQDRVIPRASSERIVAEAGGPAELLFVERGTHVANNRRYFYDAPSADWMAGHLGAR